MHSYSIEQHSHLFAAWAASRAASVMGCRFSVALGRDVIESVGLLPSLSLPDQLPKPTETDSVHRNWRNTACDFARTAGHPITHGVAAKLINCYLKSRFVCAGQQNHPNVAALHPPIDKILLEELAKQKFGSETKFWRASSKLGWSKFSSQQYEDVISLIRLSMNDKPMWMIEEYWKGNQ